MEIPKLLLLNEYIAYPNFRVIKSEANLYVFQYDDPSGRRVQKHLVEAYRPKEYCGAKLWYPFVGLEVNVTSKDITHPNGGTPRYLTTVDMPWLGHEISYLPDQIDPCVFVSGINPPFLGITREKACQLLEQTKSLLDEFYRQTGLVHMDLWVDEPINITYHPSLNYFPIIDAASFEEPGSIDDIFRFERAFQDVCDYVMNYLVID